MTLVTESKRITNTPKFDDPLEKSIYELLGSQSLNISSIEDALGMDIATIAFKLSMMEVRGIVEMNIDGSYAAV